MQITLRVIEALKIASKTASKIASNLKQVLSLQLSKVVLWQHIGLN